MIHSGSGNPTAVFPRCLRMGLWVWMLLVPLGLLPAAGPSVTRMRPMLGTYVAITVVAADESRANRAIEAAFAAIDEVDRLLSSHRAESELNAINEAAGERSIAVSPWTHECVALALKIAGESDGAFDVTCRPILDLWGFVRKEYRLPTGAEVAATLPLVNHRNVLLLRNDFSSRALLRAPWQLGERRIGLLRKGMKLDVGGIGKGFAVDKAVDALKTAGIHAGLVRVGGDLRGFGPQPWKVGIAVHTDRAKTVMEFTIRDEAVSTSGDYENYFEVGGRRYSHIIDPRTGWPVRQRHSLSVRAPVGALADAWSTALFVNPNLKPSGSIFVVDER